MRGLTITDAIKTKIQLRNEFNNNIHMEKFNTYKPDVHIFAVHIFVCDNVYQHETK